MISVSTAGSSLFTLNITASGPTVYLDNWAVIELAGRNPERQARFLKALRLGGIELLFSTANVAEISGSRGQSATFVREFLNRFGPHWIPVEMNSIEVMARERAGAPSPACVSEDFLRSYQKYLYRAAAEQNPKGIFVVGAESLNLGAVMDWVETQRDSISQETDKWDDIFKTKMLQILQKRKRNKAWFETKFPLIPFNPSFRAGYVYHGLWRAMILEGMTWKKGDSIDFQHAVMGTAFSSFAALDTHWKRRASTLPDLAQLARIYAKSDLDQMVLDMEAWAHSNPISPSGP